eukprot:Skav222186  [mRNA]  locus=scaffold3784:96077:99117:- [translate_table: standard]
MQLSLVCQGSKGHSLQWIQRQAKDRWVQRAHERLYRRLGRHVKGRFQAQADGSEVFLSHQARAVVLDLGCHAGGWSQIVLERVNGREGLVVGVDKILMEPLPNHHFIQGDIEKESTIRQVEGLLSGRQARTLVFAAAVDASGGVLVR